MNRTQRVAVWIIAVMLLTMASLALVLIPIFFLKWLMPLPVRMACLTILIVVSSGGLFFALKKQNEVDTDEMDIAIQKVAAIISSVSIFVTVGILLIAANLVWGLNTAVPLWLLMLLYGAFLAIGSIVYWGAVLIQYGRKEKKE